MRLSKLKPNWVMVLLGFLSLVDSVEATVLVNPAAPYPQHILGDTGYSIYFGGSSTGAPYTTGAPPAPHFNGASGYRFINTSDSTDPNNLIWIDVSSSQKWTLSSIQHVVVTLSVNSTAGSEIPLYGAGIVNSNVAPPICGADGTLSCQGTRTGAVNLSAVYQPGSVIRLSFFVPSICENTGASGGLCLGSAYNSLSGNTLTQSISATFSVVSDNVATGAVSTAGGSSGTTGSTPVDTATITLGISDIPPTVSCPSGGISNYYFPGDGQIYVDPSKYALGTGTGASLTDVGVDLQSVLFLGSRVALGRPLNPISSDASLPANEVVGTINSGGGVQTISGFVNTTNGYDNVYEGELYSQNVIGIFSSSACSIPSPYVTSQTIRGVLTESKCFIATAAYHDGKAAPVQMLRRFRDQILAKSEWGRSFIDTYYRVSPALAEWAWDKPIVRSFALRALTPVEVLAWALLKVASGAENSPESYLDRIRQSPDYKSESGKPEESYTDQEKKKLNPSTTEAEKSYIDRLKENSQTREENSSEGYSEKERAKLPEMVEKEGPIEALKIGKTGTEKLERPRITSAIGLKMGISPGMVVTNPNGGVSFSTIYGGGWQPDLMMHFERQLFHSEYLGSLGVGVDGGFSYAGGFGVLSFNFNGSSQSQTQFSFIQAPIVFDLNYRFNLLRILRPYIGAGAGSMFYTEVRKDSAGDKRGYSPIYSGNVGVALLLDFFDRGTALESYLSEGIQHSYLFAEFLYLNSFSHSSIYFERSGLYSGFLFEI